MLQHRGFTLIELLVVLVILALTSALVLPKFPAIYERFQSRGEQDQFFHSLASLPLKAYTQQRAFTLDSQSASELLEIPADWQLEITSPLIYKANGVCLGGDLRYTLKGITRELHLLPPYCDPASHDTQTPQ
jgi:general secretion pathway protein G